MFAKSFGTLYFSFFLLLSTHVLRAQKKASHIRTTPIEATTFIGVDSFQNVYTLKDNVFFKNDQENYQNLDLGKVFSIDIRNPFKIVLFYKNFNTVILLDNRLNAIEKIQFDFNVSFAVKASSNALWLFNQETRRLENFNYKKQETTAYSAPLFEKKILEAKGDLNNLFLHCSDAILLFDYLGNVSNEYSIPATERFEVSENRFVLQKNQELYWLAKQQLEKIKLPPLKVKDFYFSNHNLYIFDGAALHHFKIEKND
jgi:hypothetical protein